MLIPSTQVACSIRLPSLSRRVNANSQHAGDVIIDPEPSLSRRVNANSQHLAEREFLSDKLIKKGEC